MLNTFQHFWKSTSFRDDFVVFKYEPTIAGGEGVFPGGLGELKPSKIFDVTIFSKLLETLKGIL